VIERFQLLRNIGQFDSVAAGGQLPLSKFALVYAENGRGKTTLSAVLRSLGTGQPVPIQERHRLGAPQAPHAVICTGNGPAVFQNGAWSRTVPEIAVYDDIFVAENVCSGVVVENEHRQNLHELILGAQGVALNAALQGHVANIEEHNRALRAKGEAIPAAVRGGLTQDAFCALENRIGIDEAIQEAERSVAAAQAADEVRRQEAFAVVALPAFDVQSIAAVLQRNLAALEDAAAAQVKAHLAMLGTGGEAWVEDGLARVGQASAGHARKICPFCAQDINSVALVTHYRAYFGEAYKDLKQAITGMLKAVSAAHSGEIMTAFERGIRVAVERRQFWAQFTDTPPIELDTAAVARNWKAALEPVVAALRAKQGSPLEAMVLSEQAAAAIAQYEAVRQTIAELDGRLQAVNPAIALVKERAAVANLATLKAELAKLKIIKARYSPEVAPLCDAYLAEKAAKSTTEGLRDQARAALDVYRQNIFPAYERAINDYLRRFNAGFRLSRVSSVNTRGGSACTYSVLINNIPVAIAGGNGVGPSFRNTLSSGDRNTLALAFFFASLERDQALNRKIVAIDDPMTSLDEHRSLTTVQEMRRLAAAVDQVIIMSHSKPFLCALWKGSDAAARSALKIARDGAGSTLAVWDVSEDCITEHDRRHNLVRSYLDTNNAADERSVAATLRPMLEQFMRVAYPEVFPPEFLLGNFLEICRQRVGTAGELLSAADIAELRSLLDYGNMFHHDTNPAWQTAIINDAELIDFCRRTLAFTRRS
jgi:wobble nucleotide-excising tRNase